MAVKTTGAEFNRFYNDHEFGPEDGSIWHEEEIVTINGQEKDANGDLTNIPDDAEVRIEGGAVFGPQWNEDEPSFEAYFKRWRKKQTTASFLVTCDVSKLEAVKQALKAAGGRVT